LPLAVIFAVWLWLAFSSGGYLARQWLPPSLLLGLFGLVVSLLVAYPRRPRQLSLLVLSFFGCYSVWVAFSALWADSPTRVWMESGRTFTYLLVLALAVIYLTDPAARRLFRYLLMAAATVLVALCLWRLGTVDSLGALFLEKRFAYPVTAPNHAAALFLVAFWPLMWLAAGPEERAPVRGIALGLATGLLGLTVLTQSRGAIWSLGLTALFMFVISPARLRILLYLLVPALLMVYEFPRLTRYWQDGPESVGDGLAIGTILMAVVVAAIIGMILALLERWIKVSRRMKAVFGAVVLVAVIGGLVYGLFTWTRDAGGPSQWASQTWRQFTGQTEESPGAGETTRFTLLSSTGRVGIWKVAVQEFEEAPLLGVGADNFVFQHDRLRTTEVRKPRQAHSFELQVLGETGIVGGVLAFGGIALVLVGLLWPRYVTGWHEARETWLKRRRPDADSEEAAKTTGWVGTARWDRGPLSYGWEMALLAGAAYWLVHASVDWLWQMAGVSIPAVLFVAAAVAGVDGKAEVAWPRLNRWLMGRIPEPPFEPPQPAEETTLADGAAEVTAEDAGEPESLLLIPHRADQYARRISRRRRRTARRLRTRELFRPPGLLSYIFRVLMVALSLAVIILAGLPYLSTLYQDSALGLADEDPYRAAKRAEAAHLWLPTDPSPYTTQASIYARAAAGALVSGEPDSAGAVLDSLALAVAAYDEAIELEPADWTLRFHAGTAVMDLILATVHAQGENARLGAVDLRVSETGLSDWSALSALGPGIPGPGVASASLARDAQSLADATYYRGRTIQELEQIAVAFLEAADERNPLASQVDTTRMVLQDIIAAAAAGF
jgi:hypothetical protein